MKLNTGKIRSMLFCMMILLDCYSLFEIKRTATKRFSRTMMKRISTMNKALRTRREVPRTVLTLKVTNPSGRFGVGALEEIVGDAESLYNCFPEDWRDNIVRQSVTDNIGNTFNEMSGTTQTILSVVGKALELVCDPIGTIKNGIVSLVKWIFQGSNSKFFLEGKFVMKRFRTKWGLLNWLKTKVQEAGKWVKEKLVSAWDAVSNPVKDIMSAIYDKIIAFKNQLYALFNNPLVKRIIEIVTCANKVGNAAAKLDDFFNKVVTKINVFTDYIVKGSVVGWIVKFVWSLICKFKEFATAVNWAISAVGANDSGEKWYYWGRFTGVVLKLVKDSATDRRKRFK